MKYKVIFEHTFHDYTNPTREDCKFSLIKYDTDIKKFVLLDDYEFSTYSTENLVIVSDESHKTGDYIHWQERIFKVKRTLNHLDLEIPKVIASSHKNTPVHKIQRSFLETYIKERNRGYKITEVELASHWINPEQNNESWLQLDENDCVIVTNYTSEKYK